MAFGNKINELNLIKLDLFKAQDPAIGRYDVTFEVEGKLLYAHKPMLTLVSDTFDSMLSDRWTTKDKPIKIKDYSYDDFYQLITFLYSGQCELTDSNIFKMVDIAEFYGVGLFKDYCGEYLATMKITTENIFKLLDLADKYSLIGLKTYTHDFITHNFQSFSDSDGFLMANKSFVKELADAFKDKVKSEDLFQAVYKWSEKQAMAKQAADLTLDLNDAIKNEIADVLPLIQFCKMKLKFMKEYLVPRCFIFSSQDELNQIMNGGISKATVKITNVRGQTLHGIISDESVIENVKSLKVSSYMFGTKTWCWWNKIFEIPLTPSSLKKKNGVEWYLGYFSDSEIGVLSHRFIYDGHYLLAELTPGVSGFDTACGSKIEISE